LPQGVEQGELNQAISFRNHDIDPVPGRIRINLYPAFWSNKMLMVTEDAVGLPKIILYVCADEGMAVRRLVRNSARAEIFRMI